MIYQIVTIKDRAIDAYLRPFCVTAIGQATRIFTDEINNPQGDMFKHPMDYDLYHLGQWDDNTATFLATPPKLIVRGQDARLREDLKA